MSFLNLESVEHTYDSDHTAHKALDNISLAIHENEFFTLLGPSGCGKSTLLRILAGFEVPQKGVVTLDGEPILAIPPFERPINTVFQNYALFPHLSVLRNVTFGLKMRGIPKAERHKAAYEVLELVKLQGFEDRMPADLSGGQQQRVALARALACKPKLLLLDEPLSALDYQLRKDMQIELKQIQVKSATTFVFVTHDQEEALTMSDRIAVMRDGQIEQFGEPNEIYFRPKSKFVAGFIGESNFIMGRVVKLDGQNVIIGFINKQTMTIKRAQLPSNAQNVGADVEIVIRPEFLHINPEHAYFGGKIIEQVFSGATSLVQVKLDFDMGVISLRLTGQIDQQYKIGDAIKLGFNPANITVLER